MECHGVRAFFIIHTKNDRPSPGGRLRSRTTFVIHFKCRLDRGVEHQRRGFQGLSRGGMGGKEKNLLKILKFLFLPLLPANPAAGKGEESSFKAEISLFSAVASKPGRQEGRKIFFKS